MYTILIVPIDYIWLHCFVYDLRLRGKWPWIFGLPLHGKDRVSMDFDFMEKGLVSMDNDDEEWHISMDCDFMEKKAFCQWTVALTKMTLYPWTFDFMVIGFVSVDLDDGKWPCIYGWQRLCKSVTWTQWFFFFRCSLFVVSVTRGAHTLLSLLFSLQCT